MATTSDSSVSFEETDTRSDEMNSTIEQWIDDLVADVDEAQTSAEFRSGLTSRVGSTTTRIGTRFSSSDSVPRRSGLRATGRGKRTSTGTSRRASRPSGFGHRSSRSSARSARIRRATTRPVTVSTTRRRPRSGRRAWSGSIPCRCSMSPQTEGEPLPDLDTEATGDAGDLVEQLTAAADDLGVTVRVVPSEEGPTVRRRASASS